MVLRTVLLWVVLELAGGAPALAAESKPPELFEEALSVSAQFDPDTDMSECRKEWRGLIEKTRQALADESARAKAGKLDPRDTVRVLNEQLLINREVTYISNAYWRDSLFTTALMKKRGNCAATSLL
jgi:hypothetical protein